MLQANSPDDPANKKFQYNVWYKDNKRLGMFLNTDLHFFYDVQMDPVNGTSCRPSGKNFGHMSGRSLSRPVCGLAPADTREAVDRYGVNTVASRKAFMTDFPIVLGKMLRNGWGTTLVVPTN